VIPLLLALFFFFNCVEFLFCFLVASTNVKKPVIFVFVELNYLSEHSDLQFCLFSIGY
jgi:hypothetical protein